MAGSKRKQERPAIYNHFNFKKDRSSGIHGWALKEKNKEPINRGSITRTSVKEMEEEIICNRR